MSRLGTVRNIVIVLVIAAAVELLPGGGRAANTFGGVLLVAFYTGLAYLALLLYRENRVTLYSLGTRRRLMLYGALAVAMAAIVARVRMWETGFGEFVWFLLIGLALYAVISVYRYWRAY